MAAVLFSLTCLTLVEMIFSSGLSSSDKYLKLGNILDDGGHQPFGGSSSGKKIKKTKRKKKGRKGQRYSDTDEEEEMNAGLHAAVSTVMDMPEGAHISDKDDDDKDADDPHRKLNINLDAPLRDDEKLPVRTHHVVLESCKLDEIGTDPLEMERSKKKTKKEKDKTKKKKKEKKEKKKTKHSAAVSSLLGELNGEANIDENDGNMSALTLKLQLPKENPQAQHEDLEFWLSAGDAGGQTCPEIPTLVDTNNATEGTGLTVVSDTDNSVPLPVNDNAYLTVEKQKKKKEKKPKERKKEKKKKNEEQKNRSEYEEADGVATPSKEFLPPSQETLMKVEHPPMSSYQLLATNDSLKMDYETRVSHQRSDQIVVSVIFTNLSSMHIKDIEFNVLDTLNTRLLRGFGSTQHDPVKVPFILLPNSQNEGQFAFSVQSITMPQKLKGTLTYIMKTADGSTHEKLDFKVCLPCCAYLVGTQCKGPNFASLLSNGELSAKTSTKIDPVDTEFSHILAKLCFYLHFTVVEQVDHSASLYSRSIQDHHVCLLVKFLPNNQLNIDAKSTESVLLSNIIDDIKKTLSTEVH